MGSHNVNAELNGQQLRRFTKCLLDDVQALEQMLDSDVFERGIRRIGAEQELVLVDRAWRPAHCNMAVLERLNSPHVTTELAKFNVEFNLDPQVFGGDCLSRMERQMDALLAEVREAAAAFDADVVLTGILPTLIVPDMTLDAMTPSPRYYALNKAMMDMRGGAFELAINGVDELYIKHDSVMLEACNTSFQAHFQVDPEEFATLYNIAQVVAAPILAAATNAPFLFGKQLWRETRIGVFQQSVDTRRPTELIREVPGRVSFGTDWIQQSVLEIFRDQIARYKVLLGPNEEIEDPWEVLEAGGIPKLQALQLHAGTVYRWNRACYGVGGGKAHLRIENRVLPSGPTTRDEIANAAFWFGLMAALVEEYGDITEHFQFAHAKSNFLAAAREGLNAQFEWIGGRTVPADDLICKELLPLAREGLRAGDIDAAEIDRYLGVVEERVRSGQTGSQWMIKSLAELADTGTKGQRMAIITAAGVSRQKEGKPVHQWSLASPEEGVEWRESYMRVAQYMTTDLFTVNQNESIDLVANLMDWNYIRHVPVEDKDHRLVGLVSWRTLLRFLTRRQDRDNGEPVAVSEVMRADPVWISPDTHTLDAIELMRRERVSCLPVLYEDKLVGLVTEHDFLRMARALIEEKLRD